MPDMGKLLRIRGSVLEGESEYCLYCLDSRFVNAVLAVSERMLWRATWTNLDGSRYNMTAEQADMIETNIGLLTMPQCQISVQIQDISETLSQLLEEFRNMQIINNVGGCGCGCGGSGGSGGGYDDVENPPGQGVPPPSGNETDDNSWICRASYDVVERHIQFWQQVKAYSTIQSPTVRSILNGLSVFFDAGAEFSTLMGVIGSFLSQGLAGLCVDALVSIRSSLVSAIRTSSNSSQAKTRVLDIVWSSSFPVFVRTALWCVFALAKWDMVFTPDSWIAPERDECTAVPPSGDCGVSIPSGYSLVSPALVEEIRASETVTASSLATGYTNNCGTYAIVQYEAMLDQKDENFDPKWRLQTDDELSVGFLVRMTNNFALGGNDPSELDVVRVHMDNDMSDNAAESAIIENAPYTVAIVKPSHASAWASPIADKVVSLPAGLTDLTNKDYLMELYRRSGVSNNRYGACSVTLEIYVIVFEP